ncbi:uncharacterized protein EDB91DRAFT_1252753 [Suillus paluster]|uniref:uncharacterized protein n=1 Tax=Suillus paluster TaxID=48578 RepID=UPI001B86EC9F|nr:uncharacterized protein EDB91DRAFT_1252753 [Suillus paluster]KAG1730278.1 hypothetical protein EDB91DRAFT_1252753 [Suillus paluster]
MYAQSDLLLSKSGALPRYTTSTLLQFLNEAIAEAPQCLPDNDPVGIPMYAILKQFVEKPKVNAQIQKIFRVWTRFLVSPSSRKTLTTDMDEWFGPHGSQLMPDFVQDFACANRQSGRWRLGEVSTCEITVSKNDRVRKGDEIGMFHFGGSTHCLIFSPDVNLHFVNALGGDLLPDDKLVINTKLAEVITGESFHCGQH